MRLPKRLLLAAGIAALAGRRAFPAPYDLRGKHVLLTGGSRGLGLALGRELAARGARLTLVARTERDLRLAAEDLRGRGAEVQTVSADVTDPDALAAVMSAAHAFGDVDVLLHCAGLIQSGPLANMTEQDFRDVMEIHAFAPLRLVRALLPQLSRRRGRVLLVTSVGGKVAVPHLVPYSMSKFAAVGLGQGLRSELAAQGVTVTTVCPGLMRTGSARQATVKGRYEQEYALFATLDNLPLLSLGAAPAAHRIVDALVRGDAEVMVGGPALLLRYAQALAPQLTADALALGHRLLPGSGESDQPRLGVEVETPLTRNNPLKRAAEEDLNG
ncbi:SDR family NAD(P)-dependent oxidoreductase [Deinococcus wulumuqiensis]|uniref:Ketoacyl reductase n=1 Tax=Deinococcus wulumuqiensis TaxID=980427 RepID=A0AAV4K859_9DEIO|nr:SDR family oxidoreductase [Deinococcus wulumuqiensis]QII20455.1 SDR family oxidoreductase [Deinococcus wulumuqiensis R12]GGI77668.1 ketoacyl reductase [Deinococcus wulumuqiensis]GGP28865.1 ketoacyl reductase [Deinococcus wulumuqiensis]